MIYPIHFVSSAGDPSTGIIASIPSSGKKERLPVRGAPRVFFLLLVVSPKMVFEFSGFEMFRVFKFSIFSVFKFLSFA